NFSNLSKLRFTQKLLRNHLICTYFANIVLFTFLHIVFAILSFIILVILDEHQVIAAILVSPFIATFALLDLFLSQLIMCSFADKFVIKDGCLSKIMDKRFFVVKKEILITLIMVVIITIIELLLIDVLTYTVTGMIFIPYLVAITMLISYNLSAQTYKIAKYRIGDLTEEEINRQNEIIVKESTHNNPVKKKTIILSIIAIFFVLLIGLLMRGVLYMGTVLSNDSKSQGDYYSSMNNHKKAINSYKEAIDYDDENEGAFVNLADEYLKTKQYKLAIEASKSAINLDSKDGIACFSLALAYQGQNNKVKAEEYFKKARELKPDIDDFDYMKRVKYKIKLNWKPISGDTDKNTIVFFNIDRKGQISNLKIKKSSGNKEYDLCAIKAVNASAPFDPLPEIDKDNAVDIEFTFNYNIVNASKME
ncbi:MAG: TonB family protein, partial [bacterium]